MLKDDATTLLFHSSGLGQAGSASVKALPANYTFAPHLHAEVEINCCLSGQAVITPDGAPVTLETGQFLLLYPEVPHGAASQEGCVLLQMHFQPGHFQLPLSDRLREQQLYFPLDLMLGRRRYFLGETTSQLRDTVDYLQQELHNRQPNYQQMCELYLLQLVMLLSRQIGREDGPGGTLHNRHLVVAAEYIAAHYSEKLTVEQVAQECGISARQLSGLFRRELGVSPGAYITGIRISRAIQRGRAEGDRMPMDRLALECGFSSQQQFCRVFKAYVGMSPGRYFSHRQGGDPRYDTAPF